MIPNDVGMTAFHGDASLKETVLERLQWYEAEGDTKLKVAVLQEQWSRRAQDGPVLNPYPKLARAEDAAGLRISGDVSTLYALGAIPQNRLHWVEGRIYGVQYSPEDSFHKLLGVPATLVGVLHAVSDGLPPERALAWLRQFWAALPVGASVWRVPMQIVLWALSDPSNGILGLSDAPEGDAGTTAVRDIVAMYTRWSAGDKAESPDWFALCQQAEREAAALPVAERSGLLAAACAARTASVESSVVSPLPKGTAAMQILGDSLDAPGKAIRHAGLYAASRSITSGIWYEACAGRLLDILADCPVPDRASE